jgi:hypothetical protein
MARKLPLYVYEQRFVKLCNFIEEHGYFPSHRDLFPIWGVNTTSVINYTFQKFIGWGWLTYIPRGKKGIYLVAGSTITLPTVFHELKEKHYGLQSTEFYGD